MKKQGRKKKRHQTTSMLSQRNRINGTSTSMQWESGRAFLGLYSFFSKAFSLSGRQLQWASRTVSSNSWEMKGACALEKPISSKACACCSSGEGDVITEMSPVWWFAVGGGGDTVHRRHTSNCVDKDSKNQSRIGIFPAFFDTWKCFFVLLKLQF